MTRDDHSSRGTMSFRDILAVLKRRWWLVAVAALCVPLATVVYSTQRAPVYEGSSQVLLSQQDIGSQLTGTQTSGSDVPADRRAQTQAELARVPAVAKLAIRSLHSDLTPAMFAERTSVTPGANADILRFAATSGDRAEAERMAAAYARSYVRYRLSVETAPLRAAKQEVEDRIARTPRGALYNDLVGKQQTLQQLETLKTSDATVVETGTPAVQIAPRPLRNAVLGLVLGLIIGLLVAFIRDALDIRLRSAEEIADRLRQPLMARLPAPSAGLQEPGKLAMLEAPTGLDAEAVRMLRTNLEFATIDRPARSIMVTSAVAQEGKSTTMANLAIALARGGQRVVLADFDLRRPSLTQLFDIAARPGVADVALGHVDLDEALVRIPVGTQALVGARASGAGNGGGLRSDTPGALSVLPAGTLPPDPGEFVGTEKVTALLEQIQDRADVLLVDAPPILHVGDGLVLSTKVDAMVIVARLGRLTRPMVDEMERITAAMPATKLGLIVTGTAFQQSYGYGYGHVDPRGE